MSTKTRTKSKVRIYFGVAEAIGIALVLISSGIQIFVVNPANEAELTSLFLSSRARVEENGTKIDHLHLLLTASPEVQKDYEYYANLPEAKKDVPWFLRRMEREVELKDTKHHERVIEYADRMKTVLVRLSLSRGNKENAAHTGGDAALLKHKYNFWLIVSFLTGSILAACGRIYNLFFKSE